MHWQTLDRDTEPAAAVLARDAQAQDHRQHLACPRLALRVNVDPRNVAAYRKVCGFADSPPAAGDLSAHPGVRCADAIAHRPSFPFPLLGLIHLSNRIRLHRPLGGVSHLWINVHAQNLKPHPKGRDL
jgi:hypothetical protein